MKKLESENLHIVKNQESIAVVSSDIRWITNLLKIFLLLLPCLIVTIIHFSFKVGSVSSNISNLTNIVSNLDRNLASLNNNFNNLDKSFIEIDTNVNHLSKKVEQISESYNRMPASQADCSERKSNPKGK